MQWRIDRTARCCIERTLYLDAQERQPEVRTRMSDIPAEQERQFSRYKGESRRYNVKHLIISSAAFYYI